LGRVFVGHHNGGGRQTAAVGKRVVRLKGLFGHASVEVWTHLEHIPRELE